MARDDDEETWPYPPDLTRQAAKILREMGTPCLIHQPNYSMFDRWVEDGLLNVLAEEGMGCIVFSPLDQGVLTDRYLKGIPPDSRAGKPDTFLNKDDITASKLSRVRRLNDLAHQRGQSLAQMALAWVLRQPAVTSALVGASRVSQIEDSVATLSIFDFSQDELNTIEGILAG